eukprot:8866187-Pyramimonas_sp.AAC.1
MTRRNELILQEGVSKITAARYDWILGGGFDMEPASYLGCPEVAEQDGRIFHARPAEEHMRAKRRDSLNH